MQASSHSIEGCLKVANEPSAMIDPWFRPAGLDDIGKKIACDLLDGAASLQRALAGQIDRIGNLRITEAEAARPTALGAEMHAAKPVRFDDAPCFGKAPAEIDVFKPAVEGEALVKLQLEIPRRLRPNGHVAPVPIRNVPQLFRAERPGSAQDRQSLVRSKTGAENSVRDDVPRRHDDIRFPPEEVFDLGQIQLVREKVVVEECNEIDVLACADIDLITF